MPLKPEQVPYLKEHFPYSLKMLRFTLRQMREPQHYLSWNAHYESFAMHARALVRFLTNSDKGNSKASDFVTGFRARIEELGSKVELLNRQMFHLAKTTRPTATVDKFNIDDATELLNWIEKHFRDFLNALDGEDRKLFDAEKANPDRDEALYLSVTVADGHIQTACTAEPQFSKSGS